MDESAEVTSNTGFGVPETIPVQRDPQYRLFAADQTIVMFLGRDIEIAFMSLSPRLVSSDLATRVGNQMRLGFQTERAFHEVSRVRIPPDAAVSTAMTLLDQLFKAGLIDGEALRASIDQMIAGGEPATDIGSDK